MLWFHAALIFYALIQLFRGTATSQGGTRIITSSRDGPVRQMAGKRRFFSLLNEVRESTPIALNRPRVRGIKRTDVVRKQRASPELLHQVVLRLHPRNRELLQRHLDEVSYPASPLYGKHWSHSEVRELIAPSSDGVKRVENFLWQHGLAVINRTKHSDFITVEGPIRQWEQLLGAEFYEWHYEHEPHHSFIRAEEYSMPHELVKHVAAIFRTIQFPDRNFLRRRAEILSMSTTDIMREKNLRNGFNLSRELSSSDGYTTPSLINQIYHITTNRGSKHLASHAVWESIDQAYSPNDLKKFQEHFNLPVETVDHVIGGHESNAACRKDNGNDCVEANLDIQYLMAIAQHTDTTYYYWDDDDFLLSWAQEVLDMENPPLIFSISYGLDEEYLDREYAEAFDIAAMQLGLMGVTIFASAGDDGAVSPDARGSSLSCGYSPSFPASSPYVTAVGGTMGPESGKEEKACQSDEGGIITTGGGFSTLYGRPQWQDNQLNEYFSSVSAESPFPGYAKQGRGYPDVSAIAYNYQIMVNGDLVAVSGTSASSPVMAAMFSLINSARLSEDGKSSVGWINPSLYSVEASFVNDIVEGNNNCAAGAMVCCAQGYDAVTGWDPVTGLGSINFAKMAAFFRALGDDLNQPTLGPTPVPGSPTAPPVHSPSRSPSREPTVAPTIAPGWMFVEEYERENCWGDVVTISGVPTDKCLIEYDDSQNKVGSTKYTCEEYGARVEYYTDNHCQELSIASSFGEGCAYYVQDSYYSTSSYSTKLRCVSAAESTGDVLIPPAPAYDASYVMQKSYDNLAGCVDEDISEYALYRNNYCYDDEDDGSSIKIEFPSLKSYDGTGCHSHKLQDSEDLNVECEETVSYSYDMSYFYQWLHQYGYQEEYVGDVPKTAVSEVGEFENEGEDVQYYGYYGPTGTIDLYNVWVLVDTEPPNMPVATTVPSEEPTYTSARPTRQPSFATVAPSQEPTYVSADPTRQPSYLPTVSTISPSVLRTSEPTSKPIFEPTLMPIRVVQPTEYPTLLLTPSLAPASFSPASEVPTVAASVPSTRPHIVNEHCIIKIEQVVDGLVTEKFSSKAQSAFKSAVAKTLDDGIDKSDIHMMGIRDKDSDAQLELFAVVEGCYVTYRIEFNTFDLHFLTAQDAFESVSTSLMQAVTTGAFDETLHSYAVQYGAQHLLESHSPELVFKDFTTSIITDDDATSKGDDDTASGSSHSGSSSSAGSGGSNALAIVLPVLIILISIILISICYFNRINIAGLFGGRYTSLSVESRHGASLHGAATGKEQVRRGDDEEGGEVEIELSTIPKQGMTTNDRGTYNPMISNSSAVDDEEKNISS